MERTVDRATLSPDKTSVTSIILGSGNIFIKSLHNLIVHGLGSQSGTQFANFGRRLLNLQETTAIPSDSSCVHLLSLVILVELGLGDL